jgi:hypothetical protein
MAVLTPHLATRHDAGCRPALAVRGNAVDAGGRESSARRSIEGGSNAIGGVGSLDATTPDPLHAPLIITRMNARCT